MTISKTILVCLVVVLVLVSVLGTRRLKKSTPKPIIVRSNRCRSWEKFRRTAICRMSTRCMRARTASQRKAAVGELLPGLFSDPMNCTEARRLGSDRDRCCRTDLIYEKFETVEKNGIQYEVVNFAMDNEGDERNCFEMYQYVAIAHCRFPRDQCRGRCVREEVPRSLYVYDPEGNEMFVMINFYGYCSCQNMRL